MSVHPCDSTALAAVGVPDLCPLPPAGGPHTRRALADFTGRLGTHTRRAGDLMDHHVRAWAGFIDTVRSIDDRMADRLRAL